MMKNALARLSATCVFLLFSSTPTYGAEPDVVLYASDAINLRGNWSRATESGVAGGQLLTSADLQWAATGLPLAAPPHSFEFTFNAAPNTPYRVWMRVRAAGNSKFNDSLNAQFSDAVDASGAPLYRIGTTNALLVNLASDAAASSLGGWGWQDGAYWLQQPTTVRFAAGGSHTLRIQTREDGVHLDQVVLSPSTYLSSRPGVLTNDSKIVMKPQAPPPIASTPYGTAAIALPGIVQAEHFNNGGEGVAYRDMTPGNTGGAARQTDVDLEGSTEHGYNVGWITAGEWLDYSVVVQTAGTYVLAARVASSGQGGTFHVEFGGKNVTGALTIPDTGNWQKWTDVLSTVTLPAGGQVMRVMFDTSGPASVGNLNYVRLSPVALPVPAPPPPPPPAPPSSGAGLGAELSVLSWNIRIDDWSEAHARRSMERALAVAQPPQVIAIQEAYRSRFDIYIDELRQRTGVAWYGVFASICAPGGWNGTACTKLDDGGIGIFSRFPIVDSSALLLPFADCWTSARPALRAALNVNGKTVQVFNTHLQTGSCSSVMQQRYSAMGMIKQWAQSYSTPQLVAGDFNADPDQIATSSGMSPDFVESFATIGSGSRFTFPAWNPTMKLDYWFFDKSWGAQPLSSEVITSTGSESDHWAVRATFLIR